MRKCKDCKKPLTVHHATTTEHPRLLGYCREYLPGKIAEGLSQNRVAPDATSPQRLNWLQTRLGIVISCIVIFTFLATLLHFGFRTEFHDAFDRPFNDLRDTVNGLRDKDISGLNQSMEHTKTDVGRLLDWQARMAFTPSSKVRN